MSVSSEVFGGRVLLRTWILAAAAALIVGSVAMGILAARDVQQSQAVPRVAASTADATADYGIRHLRQAGALTLQSDYGIRHPVGTATPAPRSDYGLRHMSQT